MLSRNELIVLRNVGGDSLPYSVAAEPNIKQIDYLKHCGIIKIFLSDILRDTVSIVIRLAHVTQYALRASWGTSSFQSFCCRHHISPFDRHSPVLKE